VVYPVLQVTSLGEAELVANRYLSIAYRRIAYLLSRTLSKKVRK